VENPEQAQAVIFNTGNTKASQNRLTRNVPETDLVAPWWIDNTPKSRSSAKFRNLLQWLKCGRRHYQTQIKTQRVRQSHESHWHNYPASALPTAPRIGMLKLCRYIPRQQDSQLEQ
jgi:hypothetical protein